MHFDVQRRLEWHSSRENVHVRRGLSVLSRMCNAERRAAFPQICRCSPRATTAIERIVILFPGKVNNARFHLHGAVSRHIASRRCATAPAGAFAIPFSYFRDGRYATKRRRISRSFARSLEDGRVPRRAHRRRNAYNISRSASRATFRTPSSD